MAEKTAICASSGESSGSSTICIWYVSMGVEPRETVSETGTMAARLPSSPETAVLPSRLMAPIHSRGADRCDHVGKREGHGGDTEIEEAMAEGVDVVAVDVGEGAIGANVVVAGEKFHADHGARSEERRVGKECRSRWSPYH